MQMSLPMTPLDHDLEHTGDAWPFASAIGGLSDPNDPDVTRFAHADVEELHDQDDQVLPPLIARNPIDEDSDNDSDSNSNDKDACEHNDERKDEFH